MNFTEFSFWWTLCLLALPLLTIRFLIKKLRFWPSQGDSYLLAILSLMLFWNAARYSFILFLVEITLNYLAVSAILKLPKKRAKWFAAGIIVLDLLVLIYYKYIVFFIQGLLLPISSFILPLDNSQLESLFKINMATKGGIPPGISFYTFQMIGFVVDSFKFESKKNVSFINYINFASFFPQVVAGPIERRDDLFPQIQKFQFNLTRQNLESGLQWLILGLFLKLVLADNISAYISIEESSNSWLIWLNILLFSFRIYFDFAGYSLMALGIAEIIGIQLTLNFNAPYISQSIQEFWRRWHITLSSWFRDYLYIPIGGSKVSWSYLNLLIVFGISGLWHGAGWNFIIWGTYHGFLLVVHRYSKDFISAPKFINWVITIYSVMIGWLFFMDTNLSRIVIKIKTLLTPSAYTISTAREAWNSWGEIDRGTLIVSITLSLLVLFTEYVASRNPDKDVYALLRINWVTSLLIVALILFTSSNSTEFIYFEF